MGKAKDGSPVKITEKEKQTFFVDLRSVVSNESNERAAVPALADLGYGVFTRVDGVDKPALMELALAENPELKKEFVELIKKYEPTIAELCTNIGVYGQQAPCVVRPHEGGKTFDLVIGCRRSVAKAFGHAAFDHPPVIEARIVELEDEKARDVSASENIHHQPMDTMELAVYCAKQKNVGRSYEEIAEKTSKDVQTIRGLIALAISPHLSTEERQKIKVGDIPKTKALALIKQRRDEKRGKPSGTPVNPEREKTKAPSLNTLRNWYMTRDDLHELVRKWIATELLKVEYQSLEDIKKAQAAKEAANPPPPSE